MEFVLQCLNKQLPTLKLTTKKAVRLGPSKAEAPFCHVEAYPDYMHGKVRIKNLGTTKCLLNFQHVIRRGDELAGNPGDLIDLTFGTFVYRIREFSTKVETSKKDSHKDSLPSSNEPENKEINQEAIDDEHRKQMEDELSSATSMINEDSKWHLVPETQAEENLVVVIPDSNKKVIEESDWQIVQGTLGNLPVLVFGENVMKMKPKVAAFDLDGTIIIPNPEIFSVNKIRNSIQPKSNSKSKKLWAFIYDSTAETLRNFLQSNPEYKFIIVTNKANNQFKSSQTVIEQVVLEMNIPVIVFVAKEASEFLKPAPFIWDIYTKVYNEGVPPNLDGSFFCGDCAGRLNDISKGDRLFALNAPFAFKTPEEFYFNTIEDPSSFIMPSFIPKEFVQNSLKINNSHIKFPYSQEMIMMCGCSGSGKTRFVETTLISKGYFHVHLCPEMPTAQARLSATQTALKNRLNIVIDRRNIDKDERLCYIQVAKVNNYPIRCFLMDISEGHARHNLRFQEIISGVLHHSGEVELGLRRHKALFEQPTTSEGFFDVVNVHFLPQILIPKDQLNLYSTFLLPK